MSILVQSQEEMRNTKGIASKSDPYLYNFDAEKNPKTAVFLDELRAWATRRNYARDIVRILKNQSDSFLRLPKKQKEDIIRNHIKTSRGKISDAYLCCSLVSVKSLLERYEQEVNWIQIKRMLPKVKNVARDRAPTKEEIKKLLKICDLRLRAAVLILASCGIRAGGLTTLNIEDYTKFDWKGNTLGKLIVYRGEPEEYVTLISPEAVRALEDYLEFRRSKGEKLLPDSPLFRNKYDGFTEKGERYERGLQRIKEFHDMTSARQDEIKNLFHAKGLQQEFYHKWRLAGVRGKEKHGRGKPFEFKAVHGFRKYFKTFSPKGMDPETARDDVELLMGHVVSYHKPTFEHLCDQYVKALPSLCITESEELKIEIKEQESVFLKKFDELASRIEKTEQEGLALR
ncbi:MAG: hypothetical protein PXY39_04970, partial [archaeon]|nr:hypothetical protein [archaeon]